MGLGQGWCLQRLNRQFHIGASRESFKTNPACAQARSLAPTAARKLSSTACTD
jgi:hypothetical protein